MSTAENATASDNAVSTEMLSEISADMQDPSTNATENLNGSSTNGKTRLTHLARSDSLKQIPESSEATVPYRKPQNLSATDHDIEDGDHAAETSAKIQRLSLGPGPENPMQGAPLKDLPKTPPPPPEKDAAYLDPTPKTPQTSRPVSRQPSVYGEYSEKDPQYGQDLMESDLNVEKTQDTSEIVADKDSHSEIQSIMEQFTGEAGAPGKDEIMSPGSRCLIPC